MQASRQLGRTALGRKKAEFPNSILVIINVNVNMSYKITNERQRKWAGGYLITLTFTGKIFRSGTQLKKVFLNSLIREVKRPFASSSS